MYHNVEVDWKSFEYIFSGRTQYTFEYLAYIYFVMNSIKKLECLDTLIRRV
jgi:hypothetical protein